MTLFSSLFFFNVKRIEAYVVFSKLNLDGLGVGVDWALCVQGGVCVAQPGLQL